MSYRIFKKRRIIYRWDTCLVVRFLILRRKGGDSMGDWFDFNNDGKLDPFERSAKYFNIQNSLEHIKKEQEEKERERRNLAAAEEARQKLGMNNNNQGKPISAGAMILIIIGLIIVDYILLKLLMMM